MSGPGGFKARAQALGLIPAEPERRHIDGTVVALRAASAEDTPYGLAALAGLCQEVLHAGATGGRDVALNQACLRAGHFIRDGKLSRTLAERELRAAALSVSDRTDFTERKIDEKLERVIDQGISDTYVIDYGPELDPVPSLRDFVAEVESAVEVATAPDGDEAPADAAQVDLKAAMSAWHDRAVERALIDLRVKHAAGLAHKAEVAALTFREPPYRSSLTAELMVPDEPVQYAINELLPIGGNALLAAQYKTGKTTVIGDYARAFADGVPFLGRFDVNPAGGRLAIWNYELSDSQYRRWLRDLGIKNTDAIVVLHLRGYRLPITAPTVEDWVVRWLAEHEVTAWVPDPFARAAVGTDENSNTEVGVWLDTLDVIKGRAGVRDLVLPTHTGRAEQEHGQERARGATRLDDWADVRWLLTKDDQDNRYFRATGRDVDLPEELLTYDAPTRALTYGGGDRQWVRRRTGEDRVVNYVAVNPRQSGAEIARQLGGKKDDVYAALKGAVRTHRLRIEPGPKNADLYLANVQKES